VSATPLLRIQQLEHYFGGLRAVADLSFAVSRGEIVGLIGPNGSGKSTALNLISGALRPSAGSIYVDGENIAGWPAHAIARTGIARTFQLVRMLPSLTVLENVLVGMAFVSTRLFGPRARSRAIALLDRVGLGGREGAHPGELTYIDQKRLELARALAADPRVLLLDEWLAGLNPTELRLGVELIRGLKEEGRTIVLVEHVMGAIRSLCGHCVVMNAGAKIAEGTPHEVLSERQVIRAYLGGSHA
jgi:ABC-type branched-subunit amino acid transport system ATPase component